MEKTVLQPVKYKDRRLRLLLCILAAGIVTWYGGSKSILALLVIPAFYIEFGVSLIFTLLLVEWIAWVTRRLDQRYDWRKHSLLRLLYQILLGVLLPAVGAFLLAAAYFRFYQVNILETTYIAYAFPLISMLILLFNGYYFAYYIFARLTLTEELALKARQQDHTSGEIVLVGKGSNTFAIEIEDIALVFREGDSNFLVTFEGEKFYLPNTLDDMHQEIGDALFFRINRQVILHRDAVSHFEPAGYGKLRVISNLRSGDKEFTISQLKSRPFKTWLSNKFAATQKSF